MEEGGSSKDCNVQVPDHGRKPKPADSVRLQTGSPGVSTVAVKRKPRTQVAESLAKVNSITDAPLFFIIRLNH